MTISELSESVSHDYIKLAGKEELSVDPALILLIAGILVEIIGLYQDCNKNEEEATKSANNPGLFHRLLLRRMIKSTIGSAEFRRSGDALVSAFLNVGENVSVETMTALYTEVNSL